MDKKTILAFVLSLAVLIVWSILFAPKPVQKTEPQPKQEPVKAQPAQPASAQPAPSVQRMERPGDSTVPTAEEKEVTVETPLYKAVFSSTGASIKSFKLKKYRVTAELDSPLVELVHGQAPLVAIHFDPGAKKTRTPWPIMWTGIL